MKYRVGDPSGAIPGPGQHRLDWGSGGPRCHSPGRDNRLLPARGLEPGDGLVAAAWRGMVIVAIYAPPSWPQSRFETFMDEVRDVVMRYRSRPALVLVDFNVKSTA